MTKTRNEQDKALLKYCRLMAECHGLFLESARLGFVDLEPLRDWVKRNWEEMEHLRKIFMEKVETESKKEERIISVNDMVCPDCGLPLTIVRCPCHRVCTNCKITYRVDLKSG